MVDRSHSGHIRRIVTVSDAEGYSKLPNADQRDLQNRTAAIQDQAAVNARLDRRHGIIQVAGDGDLTAWPPETNELNLIADYVRELTAEVDRVNRTLSQASRIRLRFSVSAGLVDEGALGLTGQAPIKARILADSDQLRQALRRHPERSLAVIVDDTLYQDVVLSRLCGLRPEEYQRVVVRDKYRTDHVAWITVPGPAWSAPDGLRQRERLLPPPITAALIGAFAVIVAALITSAPGLFRALVGSPAPIALAPAAGTATPATSPALSSPTKSAAAGTLHKEETYHYPGTEVFRTPAGAAIVGGPASIPFGTQVWVKCWAPNESGMSSVNAFYLVETSPWAGEYAPANTFLNADTSRALDPKIPRCQATLRTVAGHQLILLGRRKASCRRWSSWPVKALKGPSL